MTAVMETITTTKGARTITQRNQYPNSSSLLIKCLLDGLIGLAWKYPFLAQDLTQIADELEGEIK